MNIEEKLNRYLTKEKIADIICKYQLYYQIGLGNVVLESLQDLQETVEKINQLNLQVKSELIIEALGDIFTSYLDTEDFDLQFEYYLRVKALSHMLDDFIKSDKELLSAEPFRDIIQEKIQKDVFFTKMMQQQFDADYKSLIPSIQVAITEDIAEDIKKVIVLEEKIKL